MISSANHKRIGIYYLLIGLLIGIIGAILSIIIRVELYSSSTNIISYANVSYYNYNIMNHGLIMIFFILMPILLGAFGNYFLVLTVGLVDIVYPRINNIGYLLVLLAYVLVEIGILGEYILGVGWTLYPPLSIITSTYLISIIFIALLVSGVSSILTGINFVLLSLYSLTIDLLLISYIITSIMILYTLPVLSGIFIISISDILLSTSYLINYGDSVIYQHLFWYFGHPEVYILILPSFGLINYTLSYSINNYIFGVISMTIALISILIFGSIVWAHHMYVVSLESDTNLYFSIVTLIIAIPTGTKLYNWLFLSFDHYHSSIFITSLQLNIVLGLLFIIIIILGGVTGIILGNNILDIYLHDSYYVIAHFHYILSIGSVVSITLTLTFLIPYIHPYLTSVSSISITHILILFLNLNLIFVPLYYLGFNILPRRILEYSDYLFSWNSVATISVVSLYMLILTIIFS